ncbi:DUF5655 domain-containing protein [Deinococcus sp. KNUC1210]|uniref:DUF5655 domain-containing protein n=1 Tax=Deinococcus sp. KNUC1210 TaxID=2917691 RepID=UPI001EEFBE5C|nr:DUF5655 domain-containing protein [Deinococcus sp. KNUC1210]ULH15488.1 DUF5655 domain-containing protein [Deinococcus sp. KNUC1210]
MQSKTLKFYFAFRRLKNFVCVVPVPQKSALLLYLKLDLAVVDLEEGFSRDVSKIGHWATGDLELTIRNDKDLERAKPLIRLAYEQG